MLNSARNLYLICYDVASPKRLCQVHKFLLGYKVGGQKSFFECWLTTAELRDVRRGLAERLNEQDDRAHIFQLDPRQKINCIGRAQPVNTSNFMIL
ncbi:CRISPR-associated endonuclease Cas2 [Dechloromonas sp.]|uniref:CRISPR-associated endonuclease Cas2 n=1 Tax=Dechloromonas sp. TaxID=1917218 RepID=UPI00217328D1|nr:CRISPR-associated endonuclease Cas2 [Dechloromonas sp.]MBU3696530.1 CRISPR-associated endonuclease Cas2 [Dechloromonas sp.]